MKVRAIEIIEKQANGWNSAIIWFDNVEGDNDCEIFGIMDIKKINCSGNNFTINIYPDRPMYFTLPDDIVERTDVVRRLVGIAELRFGAGLQVYRCYPNIEIPKFEAEKEN